MDIKEIAKELKLKMQDPDDGRFDIGEFAEALIESYKAELLNESGGPVAYMTTDDEGSASMLFFDEDEARKYSGDDEPIKLIVKPGE